MVAERADTSPGWLLSAARLVALGAVSIPIGLVMDLVAVLGSRSLGLALGRRWARLALAILGVEVTVDDRNGGRYGAPPYLFAYLNQTSLVEAVMMPVIAPVPCRILTNLEFALIPFIGWYSALEGTPVIVRSWKRQAKRAIDRAVEQMRAGDSFIISVEGRRSPDGSLGEYKRGAAVLAIRAQATVIPVVAHGARERLPFGAWRVRPGRVQVTFLPPIATRGMTEEDRGALTDRLHDLARSELAAGSMSRAGLSLA